MTQLSKEEWFRKKLKANLFIFDKNEFPNFTNTGYDPILFVILNSAYIRKNRLGDFFKALEPFIIFDYTKKDYRIDRSKSSEMKDVLIKDKILGGLTVFELNPKGRAHLDFLEATGASIPSSVKDNPIPITGDKAIKLRNWDSYIKEKYDITFSNELMDENSGIKYDKHSAIFSGFEVYSIYSNITNKNGFSIHANGSIISSLYDTYFQFIGFKVIEYFRNSEGDFKFTMIMQKINDKQVSYDEFFYMYNELKKRWPTRYGN